MIFGPFENLFDLRPIGHIVEFHQAKRRACDDQAIVIIITDIFEVTVEIIQMFGRCVARFTGIDTQQLNVHL
ncbi:hypothetical protein D3C76_1639260 [compost metagenome]